MFCHINVLTQNDHMARNAKKFWSKLPLIKIMRRPQNLYSHYLIFITLWPMLCKAQDDPCRTSGRYGRFDFSITKITTSSNTRDVHEWCMCGSGAGHSGCATHKAPRCAVVCKDSTRGMQRNGGRATRAAGAWEGSLWIVKGRVGMVSWGLIRYWPCRATRSCGSGGKASASLGAWPTAPA